MTKEKVREVLATYRKKFEEMEIPKKQFLHSSLPASDSEFLAHCHKMLDEMEVFIQQDKMEKVSRWLGFLQGCLWATGIYTVEQLKNHNRP